MSKNVLGVLLILSFCITSCEDVFNEVFNVEDWVVEGYFYKDCVGEPIAPTTLIVKSVDYSGLQSSEKMLGTVTTDVNGFFRFEHEEKKRNNSLGFYTLNGRPFFSTNLEPKKKFIAVRSAKVVHRIILKVKDSLTMNDTLIVAAQASDTILMQTGPFFNGQTFIVKLTPNVGLTSQTQYEIPREATAYFFWGIGKKDFANRTESPYSDKKTITDVRQAVCGIGGDVIIDLSIKR